jgi:hypothetical protein
MPEVAIRTEQVVIPPLAAASLVEGVRLDYRAVVCHSAPVGVFGSAHPAASGRILLLLIVIGG